MELTKKQLDWQKYAAEHREEIRAKRRARYAANPEKEKNYQKMNRPRITARMKLWEAANPEKVSAKRRNVILKRKKEVIAAYGGKCACCGDSHFQFLTIEHIHGNGRIDRKGKSGSAFYGWLRRNGFPKDDYELLCINCNFAKGKYGICPHESERLQDSLWEQLNEKIG